MLRDYESMWGELRSQLKKRVRMKNISELEKAYRERESECVRGMKEKGYEEQRKI